MTRSHLQLVILASHLTAIKLRASDQENDSSALWSRSPKQLFTFCAVGNIINVEITLSLSFFFLSLSLSLPLSLYPSLSRSIFISLQLSGILLISRYVSTWLCQQPPVNVQILSGSWWILINNDCYGEKMEETQRINAISKHILCINIKK